MDTSRIIYQEKNATVEVERVFSGDKTMKELLYELLKKKYDPARLHR